ncbi:MAG: hypothetical protein JXM69_21335 [Anaerolineae bacterium]|nr:hypothetical protein [Anaerolineae bacterium]
MQRRVTNIISLMTLVGLAVIFCALTKPPSSVALAPEVPLVASTFVSSVSAETPAQSPPVISNPITVSQTFTAVNAFANPGFEQIVNLGVPAGNTTTPRHLALNSDAGLVYLFGEGIPILKQGNNLGVYNIKTGQFVAHLKVNQGSPTPLDLQFDPQAHLLYALWDPSYGSDLPRTLTLIDSKSHQIIGELPGIETFTAAAALLYTVGPEGLVVWAMDGGTPTRRQRAELTPATQRGPMAIDPAANRLYLARANNNTWTMEIYAADTLIPLGAYLPGNPILNLLPNPATGQVFVVEGIGDLRVLQRLSADGHPIDSPFELGPRYTASGIALSADGQFLYYSNGQLRPPNPAPGDNTGPALLGLATADLSLHHNIPLLTNVDDVMVDDQTRQAFAVYPYDHLLYALDLDTDTVNVAHSAVEIRDVLADPETGSLYVSDSADRLRRLDADTFAILAEAHLEAGLRYGFRSGMGAGELALDKRRNRLYVSGDPAFVLSADTLARIATLDPGGQFAPDPTGDQVYLSNCGVTVLDADTFTGNTLLPGSGPRDDQFVPNPCAGYSQLDSLNQLLYSLVPNGTPGSNSGNYLYVYHLTPEPCLVFTDTNISISQALPDPAHRRAFVGYLRHTRSHLRTLSIPSGGSPNYNQQLITAWGQADYNTQTNRLYFSDGYRLLALDADALDVIGQMPLPQDYGYQLTDLDPVNNRLYLTGYDGQLLIARGDTGVSHQKNLLALQAAGVFTPGRRTPTGAILALESTANGHLLARINSDEGGWGQPRLFRSTDAGATWLDMTQTLSPFSIADIAVPPHSPDGQTVFAALEYSGHTGGIYHSIDGGRTWTAAMTGLIDLGVSRLFISPNFGGDAGPGGGLMLADTTYAGLHSTVDGGRHWTPLTQLDPNAPGSGSNTGAAAIGCNGVVLASQSFEAMPGVFRATLAEDGNLSEWQQVLDMPLTLLAIAPDDRTAFGFGATLWRSPDSGLTWQPGGVGLTDLDRFQANRFLFSPHFANDQTVYLFFTDLRGEDSGRLYRSTDAGQTWQPWTGPPDDKIITAVALAANGDLLFGDSEAGVTCSSPQTLTWLQPEPPATLFPIDDLAVSPNYAQDQTLFAVSHQHGLFKSTDGGQTWSLTDFPVRSTSFEGYRLAISPAYKRDQTIYAATGFSLHQSTDGGESWQILPQQGHILQAQQIALSPNFARDDTLLVSTSGAILRSTDRGQTWQKGLSRPEEAGPVSLLTFAPSSRIAYAWFDYYNTLFVGEDSGQNWQAQPGQAGDAFSVAAGATTPDNNLTLASEFPLQLWQIDPLGQTWDIFSQTLPPQLNKVQTMAYASDGGLIVGGPGGLFESADQGQSWQSLNDDLSPQIDITFLRLVDRFRFIGLAEGQILVSDDEGTAWQDISVVR